MTYTWITPASTTILGTYTNSGYAEWAPQNSGRNGTVKQLACGIYNKPLNRFRFEVTSTDIWSIDHQQGNDWKKRSVFMSYCYQPPENWLDATKSVFISDFIYFETNPEASTHPWVDCGGVHQYDPQGDKGPMAPFSYRLLPGGDMEIAASGSNVAPNYSPPPPGYVQVCKFHCTQGVWIQRVVQLIFDPSGANSLIQAWVDTKDGQGLRHLGEFHGIPLGFPSSLEPVLGVYYPKFGLYAAFSGPTDGGETVRAQIACYECSQDPMWFYRGGLPMPIPGGTTMDPVTG